MATETKVRRTLSLKAACLAAGAAVITGESRAEYLSRVVSEAARRDLLAIDLDEWLRGGERRPPPGQA